MRKFTCKVCDEKFVSLVKHIAEVHPEMVIGRPIEEVQRW